jgi:ubiquitin-associated SH3 domain-containing protein
MSWHFWVIDVLAFITYYIAVKSRFNWNPALDYMPHCSLTGFFHDHPSSAPLYTHILQVLLAKERHLMPDPVMRVTGTFFHRDFHGLTLQSPWLIHIAVRFSTEAESDSRSDSIRLKEWLHLSYAYQFKPEEHDSLKRLAKQLIDPSAPADWELRFYQRHRDKTWTCHGRWPLCAPLRHLSPHTATAYRDILHHGW